MNNTITPWTASEDAVLDADNNVICIAIDGTDAARIVLAVNNHERLVQMLQDVTEQLEDDDIKIFRCMDGIVADAARRLLNDLATSQPPHTT